MSLLLHGNCLEQMKTIDDASVDLIFCDLPYGQTSCKWDIIIPWEPFWKEIMRVKKLHTPVFFTTTTKFGVEIINNCPKKCYFRYDLVWVKSAPAGFLSAKKMPMRKHEMVYVFYEKLPFYDLSSHQHKFLKEEKIIRTDEGCNGLYGKETGKVMIKDKEGKIRNGQPRYEPPLPVSVLKEPEPEPEATTGECYGNEKRDLSGYKDCGKKGKNQVLYDPPLPVSVLKEDLYGQTCDMKNNYEESKGMNKKERKEVRYDPPLPVSVLKEETGGATGMTKDFTPNKNGNIYDCPDNQEFKGRNGDPRYDPPLPTSMLEIKSTRGKHSTEKPVKLMEWILKYYSKEGDVVLDPTMGSGSTGVACKNMNRNFIGIEMDDEIYEVAVNRIND